MCLKEFECKYVHVYVCKLCMYVFMNVCMYV